MHIIPLIEEVARFLLHGSTVKPEFDFEKQISTVDIDQNQISQVLNNLIINSMQAMTNGGTIKFQVRKVVLNEDRPNCAAGDYIKISIADTGIGIPEDSIDKIFYPYFSTKNMGSGLGLSTSLNIIRSMAEISPQLRLPEREACLKFYCRHQRRTSARYLLKKALHCSEV